MQNEFNLLAETLKATFEDDPVYYLANPGNLGDAVIRYGTKLFLKQKNIPYREIMVNQEMEIITTEILPGGSPSC